MVRRARTLVCVAVLFGAVGCGSSNSGGDGPPVPGLGGSGGTGGSAGAGGSAVTGGAAGTGASGGTGGAAGCDPSGFEVTGDLDGQPVQAFIHDSSSMYEAFATSPGWRSAILGSGAALLMHSNQGTPSIGDTVVGESWVLGPSSLPFSAQQLRAGKVTTTFGDPSLGPTTLEQLELYGPCPGTPVSGSLEVCMSDTLVGCGTNGDARVSLHGTIDGVAIEHTADSGGIFLPDSERSAANIAADWVLAIHSASQGLASIVVPPINGAPTQLICVEAGQRSDDGTVYRFQATKLSRAGKAPGTPVTGSLTLTKCK